MGVITVHYPEFFAKVSSECIRSLDLRVGTVTEATLSKTKIPALKLTVDFGDELNEARFSGKVKERQSSAQLADRYTFPDDPREGSANRINIVGKQIVAAINFPPKQVGSIMSRFLVLGAVFAEASAGGTIALCPDRLVANGAKVEIYSFEGKHIDCAKWSDGLVNPLETIFVLEMRFRNLDSKQVIKIENIGDDDLSNSFLSVMDEGAIVLIRAMLPVPVGTLIS